MKANHPFAIGFALCALLTARVQVTEADILKDPEWQQEYNFYLPDADLLNSLDRAIKEPIQIDVYMGFWCSDSKQQVPRFKKIIDHLSNRPKVEVLYFDLARKEKPDLQYYVEERRVERLPTFIVSRAGKEIGRIVEAPKVTLVEDLLAIVF